LTLSDSFPRSAKMNQSAWLQRAWINQVRPQHTAIFIALLIAVFSLLQVSAIAQLKEVRRVLIFSDLGASASPAIAQMEQAVYAGLQESPYQIELYDESLDTTLFPDEASQRRVRDWYIHKYEERKPDLIITVGPASLRFVIETHETSYPNIP